MSKKHGLKVNLSRHALSLSIATASIFPAVHSQAEALQEIVVTARKQVESLQSTPVAVSAMDQEQMRIAQIIDITDVQRTAPNLAISSGGPGAASNVFVGIRGQNSLGGTLTSDPAIGIYVDGIYVSRPTASLTDMIDVQRVEVLRGPQGTLFGRNTTGGALSVTSNTPTDILEGSLQVELGNYDHREVTGVLNMPLNENLAARIAVQHSEHDGYGENRNLGFDLGDKDQDFARASLKYTDPGDRWDLTLTFDITQRDDNGQLSTFIGAPPISLINNPNIRAALGNLYGFTDFTPYIADNNDFWENFGNESSNEFDGHGVVGTLNIDLGWADFKSITGWRTYESEGLTENDGTPAMLLSTFVHNESDQFSQEFQLSGELNALRWITGVTYFNEKASELTNSIAYLATIFSNGGQEIPGENNGDAENTSEGVFGQIYYDLTNTVTLTAGLRYTEDTREAVLKNYRSILRTTCNNFVVNPSCRQKLDTDFDYWSYLFGIDWQISEDVFLYAKTSQSYLSGGWNSRGGSPSESFEPEQVRDIEVGAKTEWLDGRLRANIALFHAEQEDIQRVVSTFPAGATLPATFISNAGSSTVEGLELELDALLWEGMTVRATLGLMDAEYDEFEEVRRVGGQNVIVDRSGEEIPQSPELTYSISLTQDIPLSVGRLTLNANYAYIDDYVTYNGTATPGSPAAIVDAVRVGNELANIGDYGLLSAKASLELANSGWTVELWGKNLTEEEYHNRVFPDLYGDPANLGYAIGYPGDPRTYGMSVRYSF